MTPEELQQQLDNFKQEMQAERASLERRAERAQQVIVGGGWPTTWVVYVAAIFILLGAGLGWWAHHTWTDSDWAKKLKDAEMTALDWRHKYEKEAQKPKPEPQKIFVQGDTVTHTEVVYKERPIDPATGKPDPVDMRYTGKQTFSASLNGKPLEFKATPTERWVFDKNQLDWVQTTHIEFTGKVDPVVIDNTRNHQLIIQGLYDQKDKKVYPGASITGTLGKHGAYQVMGASGHAAFGVGIRW